MTFFSSPGLVFLLALLLRVGLLGYGYLQDTYTPLKYTDIDYYVFTDAARFIHHSASPYARETYRYTPLLAYLVLPTAWSPWLFSFGKILFAASDLVAGWLILQILTRHDGMSEQRALKFASIWLLNPMVAAISTRGSSEGLLGVMVMAVLWAVMERRWTLAGVMMGLAVHFKIYPFIYGAAIVWWMDDARTHSPSRRRKSTSTSSFDALLAFPNAPRLKFVLFSLLTFALLNGWMYHLYGLPFLQETYQHHLTRLDHRHNFSIYNTLLHLSSTTPSALRLEKLAFLPQLLLSLLLIPLALAKRSLPGTMLAQTFAFVAFNKVCTSQYFLWYLVLLPLYLPGSSFLSDPYRTGLPALGLWVGAQALWLQQAYRLEFLGESTFVPGLWAAGVGFFAVNCWVLGVVVGDVGRMGRMGRMEREEQDR